MRPVAGSRKRAILLKWLAVQKWILNIQWSKLLFVKFTHIYKYRITIQLVYLDVLCCAVAGVSFRDKFCEEANDQFENSGSLGPELSKLIPCSPGNGCWLAFSRPAGCVSGVFRSCWLFFWGGGGFFFFSLFESVLFCLLFIPKWPAEMSLCNKLTNNRLVSLTFLLIGKPGFWPQDI